MKSSELHRLILQNGWIYLRSSGSHFIYEKNKKSYPVPYHGSKEVGKGIEKKLERK
jgi:predicted RNA binding protein YcfA (HicA-like mRNA interferase family)